MMTKKRNINLDLIRCIAVILVISVHFLHNNEFYKTVINGPRMFLFTTIRTYSLICVPLFLLLTGYLMNKKKFSKSYYKGIIKTLLVYIAVATIHLILKKYYYGKNITFTSGILSILDFTATNYSWYIEMYIGLFMMIPFLNVMYNGLESQKNKQALIITFLILTMLPSMLNIFNILDTKNFDELVIDYWIELYPITYYFIGAYLCEYKDKLKINKWINIFFILIVIIISTLFNYMQSSGKVFQKGLYVKNGSLENVLLSVLVFIFLNNLNLEKLPKFMNKAITTISELSLGIYLMSGIFDKFFYSKLNSSVPIMTDRLNYYFLIVIAVFVCSTIVAFIINLVINLMFKILDKLKSNEPSSN